MSFSDEDNGVSFTGSGIAGPYATTWRVENEDHIGVGIRDTTDTTDDNAGTVLELDTHYTVNGETVGLDSGAQVTLLSPYNALSSDYKIRLWDKTAKTQPTELSTTYEKTAVENALDHLARGLNAAQEELDRALKFSPILDDESEKVSPTAAAITNNYIPYPNTNTVLIYTASGWKLSTIASLGALSFPGSTTDGQHIRADGTDGDAYQTSALIEDDNADFTGIRHLTITGNLTLSASATVDGRDVSADGAKLDYLTVTQAVDLDTMETDVAANNAKATCNTANVDAAGAVMNSDTSTAGMSFGIDEDDMSSDSATKFPTQQSVKAYVDGQPITASYLSSGQTITAAGLLTLAHGLGAVPKLVQFYIKCTTSDLGYAIGDEVLIAPVNTSSSVTSRFNGVYWDSTNVYIRFNDESGHPRIGNKSTGVEDSIDLSDWDLYVRAFA